LDTLSSMIVLIDLYFFYLRFLIGCYVCSLFEQIMNIKKQDYFDVMRKIQYTLKLDLLKMLQTMS